MAARRLHSLPRLLVVGGRPLSLGRSLGRASLCSARALSMAVPLAPLSGEVQERLLPPLPAASLFSALVLAATLAEAGRPQGARNRNSSRTSRLAKVWSFYLTSSWLGWAVSSCWAAWLQPPPSGSMLASIAFIR